MTEQEFNEEYLIREIMKRKYPDNYPEDMMGGEFGQAMFGVALFLGLVVTFIIYLLFKFFTIL